MNRLILFFALPVLSHAAGCDAAIGDWKWFNGGTVTLTSQKAVLKDGKPEGSWECSNPQRGTTILRWKGGYTDTMNVTGSRMTGKNQQGFPVSGDRKNAPPKK